MKRINILVFRIPDRAGKGEMVNKPDPKSDDSPGFSRKCLISLVGESANRRNNLLYTLQRITNVGQGFAIVTTSLG
jgi:hypothetical protein